jgi:hypothetical protein
MPRGVRSNSGTTGSGTDGGTSAAGNKRQQRRTNAAPNRSKITTGLIQTNQVNGLSNITDKSAQLFGDALVLACNTAIASNSWEKLQPLDLVNVVVNTYTQMAHRT